MTLDRPADSARNRNRDYEGHLRLDVLTACMYILEFFYYAYGPKFSGHLEVNTFDTSNKRLTLFRTSELGRKFKMLSRFLLCSA